MVRAGLQIPLDPKPTRGRVPVIKVTHAPEKAISAVFLLIEAIRHPDMGLRGNLNPRPKTPDDSSS
jgi:hypothetical protein